MPTATRTHDASDPAFLPPAEWRALQAQRLEKHLSQAAMSNLYADAHLHFNCNSDNLDQVLRQLPVTTKNQLTDYDPRAWIAHVDKVCEWVCTSGTAGWPLDIPLTPSDLDRLAENEAAALSLAGLRKDDLFILAVAMDRMFVAGLAYWLGAQKIGATCVRAGPHFHPDLLARIPAGGGNTFLITVPSLLAQSRNGDSLPPKLAAIIAIGEPIRNADLSYNALGSHLHARFKCPILSTYANTETCTSFAESPNCRGGHLNPNLALVEILDEQNNPVPAGTPGEVTITPLGQEALPLLRFKTGDIAALHTDPCPCGRTTPRLGPILGRRQQLLKIRGASIYPNTILDSLRVLPEVADAVLIADHDDLNADRLTLHIYLNDDTPTTRHHLESHLRTLLRVLPQITYTDPATLHKLKHSTSARKPTPFLDHRE